MREQVALMSTASFGGRSAQIGGSLASTSEMQALSAS